MGNNIIKDKSYAFVLKSIKVYQHLQQNKEFILSKQFLRSTTSIGANIEEGIQGQSKKDFIHKLSISQKEAFETHNWIRLLRDSNYIENKLAMELLNDCTEIKKIITAILKTAKRNL